MYKRQVLVGGIEKMSNLPISGVTDALATAGDVSFEIPAGFTFPGFYAAMATAYMHRYGASADALLRVGIKNHDNGALNPKAQFRARIADLMAGRIAKAQQKGLPVPEWQTEMDFLHDNGANPPIAAIRIAAATPDIRSDHCCASDAGRCRGSAGRAETASRVTGADAGPAIRGCHACTNNCLLYTSRCV